MFVIDVLRVECVRPWQAPRQAMLVEEGTTTIHTAPAAACLPSLPS